MLSALNRSVRRLARRMNLLPPVPFRLPPVQSGIFDGYAEAVPSAQNAVDLLPGWNTALAPEYGVKAGDAALYDDARILWCLEQFGDLAGRTVLELGPLEAAHTVLLDRHRPALIHAIEANKLSFMRCLVVKEITGIARARFLLGDFVKWLEADGPRYDLVVASGVLYHMHDPVHLLRLMAARSDHIYLWTHYFDDAAMPLTDPRRLAFRDDVSTVSLDGLVIRQHKRSYYLAWLADAFCGGSRDEHFWLEKGQIVAILNHLGFTDVRIAHDDPRHANGPACSIFARRPPAPQGGAALPSEAGPG